MNEEIDDSEFYHQDFTTASDWEIFIARLEETINQWKIEEVQELVESQDKWIIKSDKITFVDFDFTLFHYVRNSEKEECVENTDETEEQVTNPINSTFDFEYFDEKNQAEHSCLSEYYGLDEFLVLSPSSNVGITSESKIKILLSSVYILASNLKLKKPIFVHVQEKWQKCYLGVYEGAGIRTNFEIIHLRRGPAHCSFLTGLLDLFKGKIMSPFSLENIFVSLLHTYNLSEFGTFIWKQEIVDNENCDIENLFILPFGVTVDPINTIILKTTWNRVYDNLVVDSETFSDFDPMTAHSWSCRSIMTNEPLCLLADSLSEFLQNLSNSSTVYDSLGDFATLPSNNDPNPLDLLTEPVVPTISSLLTRAARQSLTGTLSKKRGTPPIAENVLVPLLYYLFPDADEKSNYPYGSIEEKETEEEETGKVTLKNLEEEFKGLKTCGKDSLVWRLCIVLAHSLQSLGGLRGFSHIWYEFVQEMRYRWDKNMPIPGIAAGYPDLRTCLLHQKLQMLNCCIERKLSRENSSQVTFDSAEDSSSDDEFFDCTDKVDENKKKPFIWDQPVGRLSKFRDLRLLKTGDPLYIPITQEPVLKTEDQLEEDTDVLLKLGSNEEASELRARIMSASLLSDMESFKAANPGAILEDFIRWYSPRDWIEENEFDEWGQKKGQLSSRMMIEENNIWVQMWKAAKPVPAHRQKRLFDDTREAEKVLQFLDYRSIAQICELVIPTLSHVAICRLVDELEIVSSEIEEGNSTISNLIKHCERLSRDVKFQPRRFEAFIQEVAVMELTISQANSLHYKLNPSGSKKESIIEIVSNLINGREVEIKGKDYSDAGLRLIQMFTDLHRPLNSSLAKSDNTRAIFPPPYEREFVLRVNAHRPASYSASSPQMMRAVINKNEFRVAGAFSEDTVFF